MMLLFKQGIPVFFVMLLLNTFNIQAQEQESVKRRYNAIGIKPINYSNIDLGNSDNGFIGRHIGIEYERVISKNDKWSIVLPISYGDLTTIFVTDYYRKGRDLYATPGIKYYPKGFDKISGYSFSLHILCGQKKYEFDSWGDQVSFDGIFTGLLINNHLALKLSKRFLMRFELGAGLRYLSGTRAFSAYDYLIQDRTITKTDVSVYSPVVSTSIGFYFRF